MAKLMSSIKQPKAISIRAQLGFGVLMWNQRILGQRYYYNNKLVHQAQIPIELHQTFIIVPSAQFTHTLSSTKCILELPNKYARKCIPFNLSNSHDSNTGLSWLYLKWSCRPHMISHFRCFVFLFLLYIKESCSYLHQTIKSVCNFLWEKSITS